MELEAIEPSRPTVEVIIDARLFQHKLDVVFLVGKLRGDWWMASGEDWEMGRVAQWSRQLCDCEGEVQSTMRFDGEGGKGVRMACGCRANLVLPLRTRSP